MTEIPTIIYHICSKEDWLNAQQIGTYLADSLEREGFIHCSSEDQVAMVANSIFSGMNDLILLHIIVDKLWAELRWEDVDGGTFPHVYGPINLDAVTDVIEFTAGGDGTFIFPG
jgi:uncharacterized protein (DUF952 family)